MDSDEREAIKSYKEYQNSHLPAANCLYDLVAPNFDLSNYETTDRIAALRQYLDELRPYAGVLVRAAHLRQQHFLYFLNEKLEDEGHRNWRLGMNEVAADAQEKLRYWNKVHDDLLTKAIEKYETHAHMKSKIDMMARNVDSEPSKEKEVKKTVVNRPKVSKAEIQRRNEEYREFLRQKKLEEEALLDRTVKEMEPLRKAAQKMEKERLAKEQEDLMREREKYGEVMCSNPKCRELSKVQIACQRCLALYCSGRCLKDDRIDHQKRCQEPATEEDRKKMHMDRFKALCSNGRGLSVKFQ